MCGASSRKSVAFSRLDDDIVSARQQDHQQQLYSRALTMEKKTDTLTPKQRRFIEEYQIDLNATQAAIRAGYSPDTARSIGCENLTKPDISEAIAELMAARSARTKVTADKVVEGLAALAFANMFDFMRIGENGDPYIDLSNLTRDQAAALQEFVVEDFKDGRGEDARDVRKIRIKMHDKLRPLVELGKHLGMFKKQDGRTEAQPNQGLSMDDMAQRFRDAADKAKAPPSPPSDKVP
jgi:phage terminase small subunit